MTTRAFLKVYGSCSTCPLLKLFVSGRYAFTASIVHGSQPQAWSISNSAFTPSGRFHRPWYLPPCSEPSVAVLRYSQIQTRVASEPPRTIAHVHLCRMLSTTERQPDRWSSQSLTHQPQRGLWSEGQVPYPHTPLKHRTTSDLWQYMSVAVLHTSYLIDVLFRVQRYKKLGEITLSSAMPRYPDIILPFCQTRYTTRSLASTYPWVWDSQLDDQ